MGFIHQQERLRMQSIEFATLRDELKVGRDIDECYFIESAPPARAITPRSLRPRVGVVKPFGC